MTQSKEQWMEEFDRWWDENMLLRGSKTSPSGSQRIWASAYVGREKVKSFISTQIEAVRREERERIRKELLALDVEYEGGYTRTGWLQEVDRIIPPHQP